MMENKLYTDTLIKVKLEVEKWKPSKQSVWAQGYIEGLYYAVDLLNQTIRELENDKEE